MTQAASAASAPTRDAPSRVAAWWIGRRRPPHPAPPPTALVLGDRSPEAARALHGYGFAVTRWHRRLAPGQRCSAWPPAGPFAEVWVRLPRSWPEAEMLLHAAAARVPDGGQLFLYGAGNEGIRSAASRFPPGADGPRTLCIRRRCRVLAATRTAPPPRPDGLDHWTVRAPVDLGRGPREWIHYPGIFACGRLDEGSALLIDHLPPVPPGARVLDYGAGSGTIGAALAEGSPGAMVLLLDNDAIALTAAARNLPAAPRILGDRLGHAPLPIDHIVSNPPIHSRRAQSLATIERLVRDAPAALAPGGALTLVAQRRLGLQRLLGAHLRRVRTVADRGPFRVWRGWTAGRAQSARPPS